MDLIYTLLEAVVKIIGNIIILYSLWVIVSPFLEGYLKNGYRNYKRKRKIKRIKELNVVEKSDKETGAIFKHLDLLLSSLNRNSNQASVTNFILLISIVFLTTFITLFFMIEDPIFSLVVSSILGIMPYLYLRFKLINQRLKTSYSLFLEYHVFLQNYQSTDKNIYYTILNVIKEIEDKNLKMFFMKLLSSIQKERGEDEFKKAITVFTYSIGSTTAKRFGKLLEIAHIDNADISLALMDLNEDIKKRKNDMEKDKTQKLETVLLGYASLFLLPLFIFMGYRVAGVLDFWYLFLQKLPFTIFVISCVLTIVSAFSAYLLSKPRADI